MAHFGGNGVEPADVRFDFMSIFRERNPCAIILELLFISTVRFGRAVVWRGGRGTGHGPLGVGYLKIHYKCKLLLIHFL